MNDNKIIKPSEQPKIEYNVIKKIEEKNTKINKKWNELNNIMKIKNMFLMKYKLTKYTKIVN